MDHLSNAISIIKNGCKLRLSNVLVINTKLVIKVLDYLYKMGYIRGYVIQDKRYILIYLKYIKNKSCIKNIVRISTPGRRVYLKVKDLKRISSQKSNGFRLFSTNKGLLVDEEVLKYNIGGEALLYVI